MKNMFLDIIEYRLVPRVVGRILVGCSLTLSYYIYNYKKLSMLGCFSWSSTTKYPVKFYTVGS